MSNHLYSCSTMFPPIAFVVAIVAIAVAAFALFNNPAAKPALHPTDFRDFKLIRKTPLTHNTAIYRFELADGQSLGLPIGQHISISANIGGKEVMRSYTPVSTNAAKGYFDLLVKAYPQGNISKYISELKIGDTIKVRGPKGAFKYEPNMVKHVSMIAGGSGITPMYQILQAIAANPDDETSASLIFANVNEEDIFLREELLELSKHPNISVHYVLNNPPATWDGSVGFVTADIMNSVLPPPSDESKLLLCGPPPMNSAIRKAAADLGWEKVGALPKPHQQVFIF